MLVTVLPGNNDLRKMLLKPDFGYTVNLDQPFSYIHLQPPKSLQKKTRIIKSLKTAH